MTLLIFIISVLKQNKSHLSFTLLSFSAVHMQLLKLNK